MHQNISTEQTIDTLTRKIAFDYGMDRQYVSISWTNASNYYSNIEP